MSTNLNSTTKKSFTSREELNQMTVFNLSLKALESEYFKEMVIDFLISRQFNREVILIENIEMSTELKSALHDNKIKSLNELTHLKLRNVMRFPGISYAYMDELIDIMNQYDFQFDSHIEGLEVLK
jgi:hypothetical protein